MMGYRADLAFDGERVLTDGALVLVEDGAIVGVEPARAPVPDGCPVTYLPGTTLLPGLIDTHTHLCGNNAPDALERLGGLAADQLDGEVEEAFATHLASGVTAVRDLGDRDWAVVDRHRDRHGARAHGPTVVASGPPITSVGGHCAAMGGEAAGVDGLRRAVRERAERGADWVKVMASGGVMTASTDVRAGQFTDAELRAVVDEAHRLGLPVTAHAHATSAIAQCVAAGVDAIEHGSCFGDRGMWTPPDLAEAIAAAGVVVCPTLGADLAVFGGELPPWVKAAMQRVGFTPEDRRTQVGALYRGGVSLVSGTDSGINPAKHHGIMPLSLAELAASGVPPAEVLASATAHAARAIGLADRTGRLRPGLDADLLLVGGDPVADMAAIGDVRLVVSRGRIVHSGQ